MARLDRLPAAKMVAQIGSVIGREFPHIHCLRPPRELQDAQLAEGLKRAGCRRTVVPTRCATRCGLHVQACAGARMLPMPVFSRPRVSSFTAGSAKPLRDQSPERAETEPEVVAYHFDTGRVDGSRS